MPDITNGAGSNSAAAAIKAGEAFVELAVKDKNFDQALKNSQQKAQTWVKKVSASFEQVAGSFRALGAGLSSAAQGGTASLESLSSAALAALGPWGMLASGILAAGSALAEFAKKGEDVKSILDKLRAQQFGESEELRKKTDADILAEFQKIASREQRAEFKRQEFFGAPDDPKKRAEYVSAAATAYARQVVETLKRESYSVGGLVGGQIAAAILEAIEKEAPTLKLNFQNDQSNATLGIGGLAAGAFAAADLDASRQGSTHLATLFQSLAASVDGMQRMANKSASAGSYFGSGQSYGSLGNIEGQQLSTLQNMEKLLERLVGQGGTWGQ